MLNWDRERIESLNPAVPGCIYESYYFRGSEIDGSRSFWLKHNLISFKKEPMRIRLDHALVLFDETKATPQVFHQSTWCSRDKIEQLSNTGHWSDCRAQFGDGGFWLLQKDEDNHWNLSGKIIAPTGFCEYQLVGESIVGAYDHFDKLWFYQGFFPKKKITTVSQSMKWRGGIQASNQSILFQGLGMNGHNWGKEHAHEYAYANVVSFDDGEDAYFDGFSAKIRIGHFTSPFLSGGSLRVGADWFHFNKVLESWRHQVNDVSLRSWSVRFINDAYELTLVITGEAAQWVTLSYDHPSGKHSSVHNCKRAKGQWTLRDRASGRIVHQLLSHSTELETLLPDKG